MNAALPIFEQRDDVTRFARSLHLKQLEAQHDNTIELEKAKHVMRQCDGMTAASDILKNGFNYFVNVKYDYENKIWKSLGFQDERAQSSIGECHFRVYRLVTCKII